MKTITQKFDFNFANHAAIAAHKLGTLPGGANIKQAYIDVDTTFTSATDAATIALGYTGSAGAFDAAIAISDGSNPWDAAAPRVSVGAADHAVGNFIELSSSVAVLMTVAVEALTAGAGSLYVTYDI